MSELENNNEDYEEEMYLAGDLEKYEEYQMDMLDYCEECGIYGDDYYTDEDGENVCRCPECNTNPNRLDDDYID